MKEQIRNTTDERNEFYFATVKAALAEAIERPEILEEFEPARQMLREDAHTAEGSALDIIFSALFTGISYGFELATKIINLAPAPGVSPEGEDHD